MEAIQWFLLGILFTLCVFGFAYASIRVKAPWYAWTVLIGGALVAGATSGRSRGESGGSRDGFALGAKPRRTAFLIAPVRKVGFVLRLFLGIPFLLSRPGHRSSQRSTVAPCGVPRG